MPKSKTVIFEEIPSERRAHYWLIVKPSSGFLRRAGVALVLLRFLEAVAYLINKMRVVHLEVKRVDSEHEEVNDEYDEPGSAAWMEQRRRLDECGNALHEEACRKY